MGLVDRVLLLAGLLPVGAMVVAVWAAAFRLRPEQDGARTAPRPQGRDG